MHNFNDSIQFIAGHLRKASWKEFQHKSVAKQSELDAIMSERGILDYNEAFRELAIKDRPDFLREIARQAEKKGEQKGKHKRFKRFSANRRSKPSSRSGKPYSSYVRKDGSLDNDRLERLSLDDRERVVESYVKDLKK
jgi:hypothetical protein